MEIINHIKTVLGSDLVVATVAVVAMTFIFAFLGFYLAWLSYEERYGISFGDFAKLTF